MTDLNLLKTFAQVAQHLSFTKAAQVLGQPKSRVSRAVARLEADLGEELLRRSSRKAQLTETGKRLYLAVKTSLDAIEDEVAEITGQGDPMAGPIRLSVPEDMGQLYMDELISRFLERHPKVELVLFQTNQILDPIAEGLDLAIRVGQLPDSSMKAIRLGEVTPLLAASPAYLADHGPPKDLADLANHSFLSFASRGQAGLLSALATGDPQLARLQPRLLATSFYLLKQLALKDKGVALLPDFFCRQEMEAGALVRVLPDWGQLGRPIQILYPPAKRQPLRVRLLIDFLRDQLRPLLGGP